MNKEREHRELEVGHDSGGSAALYICSYSKLTAGEAQCTLWTWLAAVAQCCSSVVGRREVQMWM